MGSLQRITSGLLPAHPEVSLDALSWFAVRTRPRFEMRISIQLQEKGIKTFLPLHSATHRWSDRQRIVELPLFPGYVFVQTRSSVNSRIPVLRTNGVLHFVGDRGIGTPIPDSEIEVLQAVLDLKVPFEPHPYLEIGQRVRICGGCLEGVTGTLAAVNGNHSVVVSVNLIQRSIAMRIEGYQVEAIGVTA